MLDQVGFQKIDIKKIISDGGYPQQAREIALKEGLLPSGLVNRLHSLYPQYSVLARTEKPMFTDQNSYTGVKGFRAVIGILEQNGINIGHIDERKLSIEVYRLLATRHTHNCID